MSKLTFQIIALHTVWLPIVLVLWKYNKIEKALHWLGLFLLWGYLNDMKYFVPALDPAKSYLIAVYSLSEVLFYTWFILALEPLLALRKWRMSMLAAFAALWLVSYSNVLFYAEPEPHNSIFDAGAAIALTFLSAFALLQLTKKETPLTQQFSFWMLLGVFLYFMFSCFLFAFMAVDFREDIWFIHSFFDISKMLLFTAGVFVAARNARRV